MKIPIEMMKEIRESGYDKKLVYNYIRELLDSDKENNNLELQIWIKNFTSRTYEGLWKRY